MKKIIALVMAIVLVCCCSVTAFAAESPVATEKVTVTLRKAASVAPTEKYDVEYTVDNGTLITVKANDEYGTFNSWSIYKVDAAVEGTSSNAKDSGIVTLSVLNLATTTKTSDAVAGTDYEIVSGSLTSKEMTVKVKASVIICGNYNNVKTDPLSKSNADDSASAPQTNDLTVVYAAVIMLACCVFAFGVKKVYSK